MTSYFLIKGEDNIILYKYRPLNGNTCDSLRKSYLYFSRPSALNDPFDCTFFPDFTGSISEKTEFVKEVLNRDPSYRELPRNDRRKIIREKVEQLDHVNPQEFFSQQITQLRDEHGICCFSMIRDNILMWSHYADSHRGICLEYMFDREEFSAANISYFEVVDYSEELPTINRVKNRTIDEIPLIFKTKSKSWEYEKEVRIIRRPFTDKAFINKLSLTGIIFGCKIDPLKKKEVIESLKVLGYKLKYFRAQQNFKQYKIDIIRDK